MTREHPKGRRADGPSRTPYPFIYSRDAWDVRRFNPFGGAPNSGHLSHWAMRFAVALIAALLGGSLLLLIIQAAHALFH